MLLLSLSATNYKRGDRKVWFAAGGERGHVCGHAKTRWLFSCCPRALCTAGPFLGHGRHLPRKCLCWGVPWGPGGLHGAWGGLDPGQCFAVCIAGGSLRCQELCGGWAQWHHTSCPTPSSGHRQSPGAIPEPLACFGANSAISGSPWLVTARVCRSTQGFSREGS